MLIDPDAATEPSFQTDVCIIGAGPAGITLASNLEDPGLRILLIESGVNRLDNESGDLARGEIGGLPYERLEKARAFGIGGTSLLWPVEDGLRSRPLDPIDFEAREAIPYSGWPISYNEYERYLSYAHELAGLDQTGYEPSTWSETERAPLEFADDAARSVIFRFGSSIDVFRNVADRFRHSRTTHLMTGATVLELCNDHEASRVDRVSVVTRSKRRLEVHAEVVVLAAGGLENARLLLLSRRDQPNGLGNHHDLVGRFFQEHLRIQSGLIIPNDDRLTSHVGFYQRRYVGRWQVTSALSLNERVLRREGLLNFAVYLRVSDKAAASAPARAAAALIKARRKPKGAKVPLRHYVSAAARHPLQVVRALIPIRRLRGGPRLQLSFQSEQAPNPSSRVTLDTKRDAFGRPRIRMEWRLTDVDIGSIRRAQELIDLELDRANLGRVTQFYGEEEIPIPIGGFRHHIGTTRMHHSPRSGVVDADCRVHGTNNLFIAGSSVFPTGGYANPTLTIAALSLRLVDHIRAALRRPAAP